MSRSKLDGHLFGSHQHLLLRLFLSGIWSLMRNFVNHVTSNVYGSLHIKDLSSKVATKQGSFFYWIDLLKEKILKEKHKGSFNVV